MLTDEADIADGEDVGADLLLDLQIELLDESGFEVRGFGDERKAVEDRLAS